MLQSYPEMLHNLRLDTRDNNKLVSNMTDSRVNQLVQDGHLEHSARIIAQLEMERDDALKIAEQSVFEAIHVLKSNWSVPCKLDSLITIHDHISTQVRTNNIGQDSDQAGAGSAALVHPSQWYQYNCSTNRDAYSCSDAHRLDQDTWNTSICNLKSFQHLRSLVLELNLLVALDKHCKA